MSETEALQAAISGDQFGFQTLHNTHRKSVYRQCLRALRDPSDAEDVTQNTFLAVHSKLTGFERKCSFKTWLFRITQNEITNHVRRRSARPPSGAGDHPDHAVAASQHRYLEVKHALKTLPEIERFCVEAKMAGHSMKALGGSHHLRSAYRHLREQLI